VVEVVSVNGTVTLSIVAPDTLEGSLGLTARLLVWKLIVGRLEFTETEYPVNPDGAVMLELATSDEAPVW